jgi:hypothetical protein
MGWSAVIRHPVDGSRPIPLCDVLDASDAYRSGYRGGTDTPDSEPAWSLLLPSSQAGPPVLSDPALILGIVTYPARATRGASTSTAAPRSTAKVTAASWSLATTRSTCCRKPVSGWSGRSAPTRRRGRRGRPHSRGPERCRISRPSRRKPPARPGAVTSRPPAPICRPCTSCIGCIRDSAGLGRCTWCGIGGSRCSRGVGSLACPLMSPDLNRPRRGVRVFFAAGRALQIVRAFRVEASHPFVFEVQPAEQALALPGCGDRHDGLPRSLDRYSPHVAPLALVSRSCHGSRSTQHEAPRRHIPPPPPPPKPVTVGSPRSTS